MSGDFVLSIFGKLFGSEKIIDAGIKAGDAIVFTPEERAEYKIRLLQAYEPFKIAQRLLALVFGVPYVLAWILTFFASFFLEDLSPQLALLSGDMGKAVMAIVAFYFLGGAAESFFRSKK